MRGRRARLLCGIAGPAAFVSAWAVGGIVKDGYSPVADTISRLAEQGAATQPLMTAGFVGFGVLMPLFARQLGRDLRSPGVTAAVTVSGLGTILVACFPLTRDGGAPIDTLHFLAAGTAYVANVVAPLVAARHLPSPVARRASYAVAVAVAACLAGSLVLADQTGLLQRAGLTLFDAWAVTLAIRLLRRG